MKSTGILFALLASLCACGMGCGPETRTYQVSVRNDTHGPVTIWLFKSGGPYEEGWKSPEDIAIESPKANEPIGGRVIGPHTIATAGPIIGHFDSNANAVLRVYRGAHSFNELLAISGGNDRINAKLHPGKNRFMIADEDFHLSLEPVDEFPSAKP